MREFFDDLSPAEQKVLQDAAKDIAEQGVHIVHVPSSQDGPGFSASIGLWFHYEHPEVIVFGMSDEEAEDLLNAVADAADEGTSFKPGVNYQDLLVGYPVRFLPLPTDKVTEYLKTAERVYHGVEFPVLQLVWPDKEQRWPWEETRSRPGTARSDGGRRASWRAA